MRKCIRLGLSAEQVQLVLFEWRKNSESGYGHLHFLFLFNKPNYSNKTISLVIVEQVLLNVAVH